MHDCQNHVAARAVQTYHWSLQQCATTLNYARPTSKDQHQQRNDRQMVRTTSKHQNLIAGLTAHSNPSTNCELCFVVSDSESTNPPTQPQLLQFCKQSLPAIVRKNSKQILWQMASNKEGHLTHSNPLLPNSPNRQDVIKEFSDDFKNDKDCQWACSFHHFCR